LFAESCFLRSEYYWGGLQAVRTVKGFAILSAAGANREIFWDGNYIG
jgi:hypothetical protein